MDLNELFRRHQLALIAATQRRAPAARSAAARLAARYAAIIEKHHPLGGRHRAVLSVKTLLGLYGRP